MKSSKDVRTIVYLAVVYTSEVLLVVYRVALYTRVKQVVVHDLRVYTNLSIQSTTKQCVQTGQMYTILFFRLVCPYRVYTAIVYNEVYTTLAYTKVGVF